MSNNLLLSGTFIRLESQIISPRVLWAFVLLLSQIIILFSLHYKFYLVLAATIASIQVENDCPFGPKMAVYYEHDHTTRHANERFDWKCFTVFSLVDSHGYVVTVDRSWPSGSFKAID